MATKSMNGENSKIYFAARHGETHANIKSQEKMRGQSNMPLDEKGRQEAVKIGHFAKEQDVKKIYHSPIQRVAETAKIVAEIAGVPREEDGDLKTWDPGFLTGRPVNRVQRLVDYYETHPDATVPDGETTGTFHKRASKAWAKYDKLAAKGEGPFMVLAHTRPLMTLEAIKEGHTQPGAMDWAHAPEPGSVLKVLPNSTKLVRGSRRHERIRRGS